jgi:pimeloyl-ACP methyl ester carboxylesterase
VPDVQLQAGTIRYQDTGGSGPVVVLLHGLAMDGSLWRHVVHPLRDEYRCVVPTLPLGGRGPRHAPSMGGGWPRCSPASGCWRSPAATPSSPRSSPPRLAAAIRQFVRATAEPSA